MVVGTHRGTTTLGIMDIPGDGAVRGITADGTTLGIGILGTIADGTVAGMADGTADGMIRGTTEDGVMVIITTTATTSSVREAAESIRHACQQPAPAGEAALDQRQEARA